MEQLQWLADNWGAILVGLSALLSLASAITRLTPSPKDDEVVSVLQDAIGRLSLLDHHDSPRTVKGPLARTWRSDRTEDDIRREHEETERES